MSSKHGLVSRPSQSLYPSPSQWGYRLGFHPPGPFFLLIIVSWFTLGNPYTLSKSGLDGNDSIPLSPWEDSDHSSTGKKKKKSPIHSDWFRKDTWPNQAYQSQSWNFTGATGKKNGFLLPPKLLNGYVYSKSFQEYCLRRTCRRRKPTQRRAETKPCRHCPGCAKDRLTPGLFSDISQ